jgi:hypothetical protein
MRFMVIVKATKKTETGALPEEKMIASMATFHEELVKAGVLLDVCSPVRRAGASSTREASAR